MEASASYSGFPSDTNLLVAACIQRVREEARLDADAVLPPLPRVMPRRDVVILTRSEVASGAGAGMRTGHGAPGAEAGDALRTSRALATTQCVSRLSPKRGLKTSRWALF